MSAPLTCPLCGGKASLVEGEKVFHPAGEPAAHGDVYHAYFRHESYVACTRCEFAETVETLLSGSTPKRLI